MLSSSSSSSSSILEVARREVGYQAKSDPLPGSKYGRWAADKLNQAWLRGPSNKIWWCMCFASYCVYEAGYQLKGGPQFNTDSTIALNKEFVLTNPQQAQPGDVVIFDWDKRSRPTDHVGILVSYNHSAQTVTCIEGNTSRTMIGSQSAGNGVWERTRPYSTVAAIIRPQPIHGNAQPIHGNAQPYLLTQPTHIKEVNMIIVRVGATHYVTDGMTRRVLTNMESLQTLQQGGVPIVVSTQGWLDDTPEAFNPVVLNARVKDIKDLLTDFEGMSDSLKGSSILRKILGR